jgi:hypothetical protein
MSALDDMCILYTARKVSAQNPTAFMMTSIAFYLGNANTSKVARP